MKQLLILIFAALPLLTMAQEPKKEGVLPPNPEVLHLIKLYDQAFELRDVSERDAKRKDLVSPGYFYHGMDGAPISLEGLTKRQTKNDFKVFADSTYDEVLYQYENTAVLIFKEWQHLKDKGVEKEVTNSVLILMGKENNKWVVIADIIGMKPKNPVQNSSSKN
jgi:hypothetical protein